jgi:hypothetical protein
MNIGPISEHYCHIIRSVNLEQNDCVVRLTSGCREQERRACVLATGRPVETITTVRKQGVATPHVLWPDFIKVNSTYWKNETASKYCDMTPESRNSRGRSRQPLLDNGSVILFPQQ